jgi:hypothetical protein
MATADEVRECIARSGLITFTWRRSWHETGTPTCVDDFESGVYYKAVGQGLTRSYAMLKDVLIIPPGRGWLTGD